MSFPLNVSKNVCNNYHRFDIFSNNFTVNKDLLSKFMNDWKLRLPIWFTIDTNQTPIITLNQKDRLTHDKMK